MKEYYVYKHTFPNEKVYIGITSQKPEARWNKGKGYRRKQKGKWVQPLMARAVGKYDWDEIKHEVLFEGLTKEEAEVKEIELIAFYKSCDPEFGYNIENGGNSNGKHSEATKEKIREFAKTRIGEKNPNYGKHTLKGNKLSDATKLKISEAKKGHEVSQKTKEAVAKSNKRRIKKVIQYDLNMNLIKVWDSAEEAHTTLSINKSSINACCRGDRKTAGGFIWSYYNESEVAA